jgi:hypothetical protein
MRVGPPPRFLPRNESAHSSCLLSPTLEIDRVDEGWNANACELRSTLRAKCLAKNLKVKDDQGRMSLRVGIVATESEAIKFLLTDLALVNAATISLLNQ